MEQMQDGYYVLRYQTEGFEFIKVFRGVEGVDADSLEREPDGLRIKIE